MDALKKRTRAATRNQPKHDPNVPIINTPRHKTRINFALINTASIAALPAILARILPGGRIVGREYLALNPRRPDRRCGSFKLNNYRLAPVGSCERIY
jgi:hypothetical protein